ncbi:PH domain-containing protein [Amycolatopsis sp. NPDC059657]|uniref:PH domain-containing protein n=1 Tax=Amycolatopsis sp. NPDC059657 TaxID=3346899 RepID=UPI00366D1E42
MDNSPASWAPAPAVLAAEWLITALAAVGTIAIAVGGDPRGAVLFGLVTLVAGAFALHSTLVRPRLSADSRGIRAKTLTGSVLLPWGITRVRLRTTRRLGRDGVTLEIEAEDRLLVFGRMDLGEDPRDVLDVLSALRAG